MSETAPEQQSQSSGGSNVFMRKVGPLPMWGWMGIGLALALVYYFWKQNKASQSATQSASSSTTSPSGTDQNLIPQFVNQTYVQGAPPSQPSTPTSTAGSTGTSSSSTSSSTTSTGTPAFNAQQFLQAFRATGQDAGQLVPGATGPPSSSQVSQYPAPSGVSVSKLTNTSGLVKWNNITSPTPAPTSYTVAVYQLNGKLAQQFTVNAPDNAGGTSQATIQNLHSGWAYNVNVWANGGSKAPPHSTAKLTL